jgi:hypothetical protein
LICSLRRVARRRTAAFTLSRNLAQNGAACHPRAVKFALTLECPGP